MQHTLASGGGEVLVAGETLVTLCAAHARPALAAPTIVAGGRGSTERMAAAGLAAGRRLVEEAGQAAGVALQPSHAWLARALSADGVADAAGATGAVAGARGTARAAGQALEAGQTGVAASRGRVHIWQAATLARVAIADLRLAPVGVAAARWASGITGHVSSTILSTWMDAHLAHPAHCANLCRSG